MPNPYTVIQKGVLSIGKACKKTRSIAVCARLGKMPTPAEYLATVGDKISGDASVYRYLNFDQMPAYTRKIIPISEIGLEMRKTKD